MGRARGFLPGGLSTLMHDNGSEKPDVLIVIVCYRVADLTIDCLRSLKNELARVPGARVAICENGSGDDSAQRIADAITSLGIEQSVSLSTVAPNRGFAGGNNFILRQAITGKNVPRHLLLLNADTIVHEGCLRHCLEVMDADPSIGALGCAVLNPDGTPQAMARRFPTPLRALVSSVGLHERMPRLFGWGSREDPSWDRCTTRRDVDWLGGCFLWVRGDLMEQIGVLDEDFGFYGEDIEYCHRVWRSGHRCHYDPTVSITHLGGGQTTIRIGRIGLAVFIPGAHATWCRASVTVHGQRGCCVALIWGYGSAGGCGLPSPTGGIRSKAAQRRK